MIKLVFSFLKGNAVTKIIVFFIILESIFIVANPALSNNNNIHITKIISSNKDTQIMWFECRSCGYIWEQEFNKNVSFQYQFHYLAAVLSPSSLEIIQCPKCGWYDIKKLNGKKRGTRKGKNG